ASRSVGTDRGVVAGAHGIEAQHRGALQQGGELDPLVAAHARVRGAAGGVLGQEVLDHQVVEVVREVPDVVRDTDPVGRAAGVGGVLDGAAAAGAAAGLVAVLRQRHVHSDHLVAGLGRSGGGHGGVHTAAHRCQHLHPVVVLLGIVTWSAHRVYGRPGPRSGPVDVRCAPCPA